MINSIFKYVGFFCLMSVFCCELAAKNISKSELANLVTKMTKSPHEQQIALQKLAKVNGNELEMLRTYFYDKRKIADTNVRFLNTGQKSFEKYFLTYATTVDELLMQYYCFRTERCVPPGNEGEREEVRKKFSTSSERYRGSSISQPVSLTKYSPGVAIFNRGAILSDPCISAVAPVFSLSGLRTIRTSHPSGSSTATDCTAGAGSQPAAPEKRWFRLAS